MPRKPKGQSGTFSFTTDTLRPGIATFEPKLSVAIGMLMEREAQNVQDYARVNAKWTDQTGNARQGLFARHSTGGGRNAKGQFTGGGKSTHNITLYHTMPYGIWLEVRWAGKYAIIVPTIQVEGARIMGNVNKLMAMMA